ncbi:helix-turn-helix domain-containing protein [Rhodococcus erythropolis]|uniref:helix-turn-helix domain-containing protein n=1 Tax=Rhodococcus erythropolis TaxID=1833 RepID=UPI001E3CFB3F|nr:MULTISPECIES: helix-turn-helix domain-containing protein [Rhodococcus erythropolis group]MCD2107249.1 helix-turn-helix domain-containing protein [Rhodococcus qingshengii]MCZ4526679.1 helix-turn-helix domain-containing protein [Rhodococcus erythropolis]
MTDLTSTYDFSWSGTGASQCLYVPMDRLGLPIDTVRDAATRPHHSNLYPLMIAHIRQLFRGADLPIAAIAHRAGFVDAGHFSRRFRQAYGVSPTRWRQLRD